MKKQGFIIAKNGIETEFFTSKSSYDHPIWLPLTEATIYPTAEIAQNALLKLLKYGAYSAKLVEASSMEFEFPDEGPNKDQENIVQTDAPEDEMTTGQLSDDSTDELNLDDDDIEMGDDFEKDEELEDIEGEFGSIPPRDEIPTDDESMAPEENEQSFLSPMERKMMAGKRPSHSTGNGPVREGLDSKAEVIKFKQKAGAECDTNFADGIEPLHHDVKIPSNVLKALRDSIAVYNDAADFNNGRDDAQASMSLTIADALRTIEDCLNLGTHEGLKQAQIKITTFMNPITTHFPPEVIDYLYKSGRQPMSLKDIFYNKWDNKPKKG